MRELVRTKGKKADGSLKKTLEKVLTNLFESDIIERLTHLKKQAEAKVSQKRKFEKNLKKYLTNLKRSDIL